MVHDIYYMISPKPHLLPSLEGLPDEIWDILSSSKLWTAQLQDRSALSPLDTENLVKALFLLDISEMPEVLIAVFTASGGGFQVSTEFFDKFWDLNRIYEDGNIKESLANYSHNPRFIEFVRSSNDNIQRFINSDFSKA